MRRTLSGTIISTSMNKTLAVRVDRVAVHPKYKKRYKVSKKFLVHDPYGTFSIGEKVTIQETRPISKLKHWIVLKPETANPEAN